MKKVFGFIGIIVGTQLIVSALVFADTEVSGIISTNTVWDPTGSPYIVTGNVLVDTLITLDIQPGVEVKLDQDKYIMLKGNLYAIGTETDSIIISARDTTNRWSRLWFKPASVGSLKYCRIEYANSSAIYNVQAASLYIGYNTITGNSAAYDGGGIYSSGSATITGNTITGNSAARDGGGISSSGSATITGNTITGNSAASCCGGGIYSELGSPTITGNTITGNSAKWGGGIYNCYGSPTITGNTITDNSAAYYGGGIYSKRGSPTIRYNTLIDTTASAIYIQDGTSFIRTNNISATGYAIYLNDYTDNVDARYNWWNTTSTATIDAKIWDFYDDFNKGKVFYQPFLDAPFSDTIAPPPPIDLSAVNTTGLVFEVNWTNPSDPSGISEYYYKLGSPSGSDFDTTGTFHYPPDTITATQLGESLYVWLVDSSGNLLYTDYSSVVLGKVGVEESSNSQLTISNPQLSTYPNPSFGNALIKYGVPERANVSLGLYDISGRLVKTIYAGTQEKGYYEVDIKQDGLKGGIYFIRFETNNYKATRKLTIIR